MANKKQVVDPRKRQYRNVTIFPRIANNDADYNWNDEMGEYLEHILKGTLQEVVEGIMNIPNKFNINPMECSVDFRDPYQYKVYGKRIETEAEYAGRIKKLDAAEAKELAMLKKLQDKYSKKIKKAA
jgi:hypothetical protein